MAAPRKKKESDGSSATAVAPLKAAEGLYLIYGDDDFLVTEEARKIITSLTPKGASEFSVETIDGAALNQGEATTLFRKLFDSLQSQSFFATEKVVWWRNTNLLGPGQTASGAVVADFLSGLVELLQKGLAPGTTLVITASELDGRKTIAKTLQKLAKVTSFKVDPYKLQEQRDQALDFARQTAEELGKELDVNAGRLLVEMASGDHRTLRSEIEKVATYLGEASQIDEKSVRAIGSWRPGGVVWDLPDALGSRNLGKALEVLDGLLFMGETPVGLLFALISRVRLLLLLRVLVDHQLIRPGVDYASFKSKMDKLPDWVVSHLPEDKKLNPLAGHPFALWKASAGAANYTQVELRAALEALLQCNERLVSSGGDPRHTLEEVLVRICMK